MAPAPTKPDAGTQFLIDIAKRNPANAALPPGLQADPTYLSFLRGIGYTYNAAVQKTAQDQATARANYETQNSRLPEQLRQAQEQTDTGLLDRGVFNSGERVVRETRNQVTNQNAAQDLLSARATALQGAQQGLEGTIADLSRQQADAVGGLQSRRQQQTDQDKYIRAVAGGGGSGGGGGSISVTIPGAPGQPATPTPAAPPPQPTGQVPTPGGQHQAAGQPRIGAGQAPNDYLSSQPFLTYITGLPHDDQARTIAFLQAQYPGADFGPTLRAIAGPPPGNGGGYSGGGGNRLS